MALTKLRDNGIKHNRAAYSLCGRLNPFHCIPNASNLDPCNHSPLLFRNFVSVDYRISPDKRGYRTSGNSLKADVR
jgi:hypothetical protein